jgi:4-amino-4-deoxy-L-arabinose transferase-like glycosyltransferase
MTSSRASAKGISFPLGVFLAALVLRLIPVLLARSLAIGLDDMFQYDMLARSLAAGDGFRWYASADLEMLKPYVDFDLSSVDYDPVRGVETSFRAPLYPVFLSLIYLLVGSGANRFFAARLAQTLLGAALAPLTYLVAKKIFPENERAAKISAWTVAAYPILLAYPLGLGTENPFFLLLLASFFFLLQSVERPSAFRFLLSGFFLGLTVLTRSVILPFAALAILWTWFVLKQKRGALLVSLALALTISPWIVRNSLLHHKLTGIETSMGYNLYLGYHPQGNGSFVFGPSLDLLSILDDAERDRVGTQKAIQFIRAEPERFIPLAVNRLGFFFGLEKRVLMYFYGNNIVGFIPFPLLLTLFLVMLLPFVIVCFLAALGASLLRWSPPAILLGLLFFAYILPHVFILAEDRFHLALVPFFAILASNFWTNGWKPITARWNESRMGKIVVAFAVLAALLLLLNWGLELSRDADKIIQLLGPNGNFSNYPY